MSATSDPQQHPAQADPEPFGQKGIRQYLFPFVSSASLALMVLSTLMWARSHYIIDAIAIDGQEYAWQINSIYGRIVIAWGTFGGRRSGGAEWSYQQQPLGPIEDRWKPSIYKRLGMERGREPITPRMGTRGGWIRIRWPLVIVLCGVLPLARLVSDYRHRRMLARLRRGECPRCGLNIRSTPGHCPRCGEVEVLDLE